MARLPGRTPGKSREIQSATHPPASRLHNRLPLEKQHPFAPGLIAAKPEKPCDGGVFGAFYLLLKKEQCACNPKAQKRRSACRLAFTARPSRFAFCDSAFAVSLLRFGFRRSAAAASPPPLHRRHLAARALAAQRRKAASPLPQRPSPLKTSATLSTPQPGFDLAAARPLPPERCPALLLPDFPCAAARAGFGAAAAKPHGGRLRDALGRFFPCLPCVFPLLIR